MAISVVRLGAVRSSSDREFYVTYTQKWRVRTGDKEQGHTALAAAVGVVTGDAFVTPGETNLNALATDCSVDRVDEADGFYYHVTWLYDSRPQTYPQTIIPAGGGGGGGGGGGSPTFGTLTGPPAPTATQAPLVRPWQVAFGDGEIERLQFYDLSDPPKPMITTAGQLLSPGLKVLVPYTTLTFTGNMETFSYTNALLYKNTTNDDTWLGFPPGQLKCVSYTADPQFEQGVNYYSFKLVVHVANPWLKAHDDTPLYWDDEFLNAGTKQKVAGQWQSCQIHGVDSTEPLPLDAAGVQIPPPADPDTPTTYVWLRRKNCWAYDWSNIL